MEDFVNKFNILFADFTAYKIPTLSKKISKDWKVDVDFENYSHEFNIDRLLGFHDEDNGLNFMGFSTGGDWEFPVFSLFYWDGKDIRLYTPTDGNPWNTDTNRAFGNDAVADFKNIKKRWPEKLDDIEYTDDFLDKIDLQFDKNLVLEDIKKRLILKEDKPAKKKSKEAKIAKEAKITVPDRLSNMPFYGLMDEAYEEFWAYVAFVKLLWNTDQRDKAEITCDWAKELSDASIGWALDEWGTLEEAQRNMDYEVDHWN